MKYHHCKALAIILAVWFCLTAESCSDGSQSSGHSPSVYDNPGQNNQQTNSTQQQPYTGTYFGFNPFPYDLTPNAVKKTYQMANANSNLYVIQRDNGIPWYEALHNKTYPKKVRDSWDEYLRYKPKQQKVYLALAPLAEDRTSLIHASEGSKKTGLFNNHPLDHPKLKQAYYNYVRRAVQTFKPDFLNIGVEVGELAFRAPEQWYQFENLFEYVKNKIKQEYPSLPIGISFGLQSLMDNSVAIKVRPLISHSDFLGISFYPYMSTFHEKFGAKPLPNPPNEWRQPFKWLKQYSPVPIAICETGYSSQPVNLKSFKLKMQGGINLQKQYVEELANIAIADNYLFVAWYGPVDLDMIFKRLNLKDDSYTMWQNIGLHDQHMKAKPAWNAWKKSLARSHQQQINIQTKKNSQQNRLAHPYKPNKKIATKETLYIGFTDKKQLFKGSPHDEVKLKNAPISNKPSLRWSYRYKSGRWQWLSNPLKQYSLTNKMTMEFSVYSTKSGSIILQLEEKSGEAFYAIAAVQANAWSDIEISFNNMQIDPQKQKNGKMDKAQINKLFIADPGAVTEGKSGKRKIWFTDWYFK